MKPKNPNPKKPQKVQTENPKKEKSKHANMHNLKLKNSKT